MPNPPSKEPHVRHIREQLWEIRLKGKAGIARALYVTEQEQRVGSSGHLSRRPRSQDVNYKKPTTRKAKSSTSRGH
jgi:hypothetical protein